MKYLITNTLPKQAFVENNINLVEGVTQKEKLAMLLNTLTKDFKKLRAGNTWYLGVIDIEGDWRTATVNDLYCTVIPVQITGKTKMVFNSCIDSIYFTLTCRGLHATNAYVNGGTKIARSSISYRELTSWGARKRNKVEGFMHTHIKCNGTEILESLKFFKRASENYANDLNYSLMA